MSNENEKSGPTGSKQGTGTPDGHGRNPTPQTGPAGAGAPDIKDDSAQGEQERTERAKTTKQDQNG